MFAHVPAITARLAAALGALGAGWAVSDGTQSTDRRTLPRADVSLEDASLSASSGPSVTLQPRYTVTLCIKRESTSFAALDAALDTVIAQLHHWPVPAQAPGAAARLKLQALSKVEFEDQALFGYDLAFTLPITRQGCNR